jgi:UDP-N-acetylglucosamine 2-epimerase
MKVVRIVGARPQFMQVPPVRNVLLAAGHTHILIHTGQHYDYAMSQGQLDDLGIGAPDYNLEVGSGPQGMTTGRMIEKIEALLMELRPDLVVVDGDTNSTLASAIAVVKLGIPLVHIEAGVRERDRSRPEETNRILTDHCADINCAPVPRALEHLRREGLGEKSLLTGDVLLDCLCLYEQKADAKILTELGLKSHHFHLMTLHRPENTDHENYARFCAIMRAVSILDKPVIWPLHPRSAPILTRYQQEGKPLGMVRVVPPLTYLQLLALLQQCDMVLTDSGGLPREAAWNGKRCAMLSRLETWHDLVEKGWATIGKTDEASLVHAIEHARPADAVAARAFFGSGQAAARILEAIESRVAI